MKTILKRLLISFIPILMDAIIEVVQDFISEQKVPEKAKETAITNI